MTDKLTYKRLQVLCDDISLRLADVHYLMNQQGFKKTKEWRAELSMLEKTFTRLSLAMRYFGKKALVNAVDTCAFKTLTGGRSFTYLKEKDNGL